MIRLSAQTDTAPIDAMIDLLESQDKIVAAIGQRVYDRHAPAALEELRHEPGPVKKNAQGKLDWTSDKQRIKVMILYREQGIQKWERGQNGQRLSEQWEVTALIQGNVFSMTFQNTSPIAKFVYGSLAQNAAAALRFKQKFHAATGWLDASPVVAKWVKIINDDFKREWRNEVTTRRRAYTRGTRRSA